MEDLFDFTQAKKPFMKDNGSGVALVSILGIIAIGSILLGIFLYLLERGGEISILEKKYRSEKEAALGAVEFLATEFLPESIRVCASQTQNIFRTVTSKYNFPQSVGLSMLSSEICYRKKLLEATDSWGDICSGSSDPKTSPDMKFTLRSSEEVPYEVYVKIVDTTPGNTNLAHLPLEGAGVAESQTGIITPRHFPYLYRIEVMAERQLNPKERVSVEVLYGF